MCEADAFCVLSGTPALGGDHKIAPARLEGTHARSRSVAVDHRSAWLLAVRRARHSDV